MDNMESNDIQKLLMEMLEKIDEEMDNEEEVEVGGPRVVDEMCTLVSEILDKENDQLIQIGGARLKEIRRRDIQSRGRFTRIVKCVNLDVSIPRVFTTDPDGPEKFSEEIIKLIKKYLPSNASQQNTKVGVSFESDEIFESVGLPFKELKNIHAEDIVRSMEEMVQSNKSPLELEVPKISVKITYITPPTGSGKTPPPTGKRGRKRRFDTTKILEIIAFEKKKRARMANKEGDDFLDDECGEASEDEEEETFEDGEEEYFEDEETEQSNGKQRNGDTNIMKNNVSEDCLPHALYQALMHYNQKTTPSNRNRKKYNASLRKNDSNPTRYKDVFENVRIMKEKAGIVKSENFDWVDIDQFQKNVFNAKLQILVFEGNSSTPFYRGPFVGKGKQLVLCLAEGHFSGVRNVCPLLKTSYYCGLCDSRYRDAASHYACRLIHRKCGQIDCTTSEDDKATHCDDCSLTFPSQKCFDNHKKKGPRGGKSRCQHTKFCKKCEQPYFTNKNARPHSCGEKFCHRCQQLRPEMHHCTMMPSVKNESRLSRQRIYFDIESRADDVTGQQFPVLFVAFKSCPECPNLIPKDVADGQEEKCGKCSPDGRLKVIECITPENRFVDVASEMTKWCFSEQHKGSVLVAHNASGYDGQFILENMIASNKAAPEVCLDGSKITTLNHNKVRLVDSMKYLPMSLSAMGKSFEIDAIKGDFPVLFIKPEYYDYDGPLPDDKFYGLENKSPAVKAKLVEFLAKERSSNKRFNFYEELLKYCYNDVYILSSSMRIFESAFEVVNDVCVCEESITIPAAAALSFRRNHLDPLKPIVLDSKPSVSINSSVLSQKYLAWFGHSKDVQINISTTYGEEKIGGHRVDGFVPPCAKYPDGLIIEFLGCYWHAHDCTFAEDSMIGERSGKEIRMADSVRIQELEKHNPVKIVWECQVKNKLSTNNKMKEFFDNYEARDLLQCERALVGGRTEVFKLAVTNDGQKNKYLDVVSLYPTVMKHEKFMIGAPEDVPRDTIVVPMTKPEDLKFDGFLNCKILAPQDLLLPLIPDKSTGKLVFALCKKCAKEENQDDCEHTEDERAFTGVFTTVELRKALSLGYKILEVYHGVQYEFWVENDEEGQGGLFTSYIDKMMKEKIYSSGWPSNVKTDEEKEEFCRGYLEKEHISLDDHQRFEKNPGKRTVAKLLLNSLWGKFAQRVDRENTVVIIDPGKFFKLYHDKSIELITVRPVNDVLIVKYRKRVEELSSLKTSAIHIAAYVTSYARLRLYAFMERVGGKNIVYTDTDSIIYSIPDGEEDPLADEIGPYLGQLTDELEGEMTEFVTLGPKTYCYKDRLPDKTEKVVRKAKGVTLNATAEKIVTFDKMKIMVGEVLANVAERTVQHIPQHTMRRDQDHRVYSKNIFKQFKYTFNKRRVLPDGTTLPFGYKSM